MSPPILVGVDPVHHDPDAPVLAALLARATGAPLVAVAAYRDDSARGDAMARLNAVEPAFHGLALETRAVAGASAARVLHDCAEARGAGLLVLGSTHRGVIGRIALGSTADRLLHGGTLPVAVAPLGFADRMRGIDRVGVAFVESEEGYEALRAAAALATACGAELSRSHRRRARSRGVRSSLVQPYDVEAHLDHLREQARTTLRRALDGLHPAVQVKHRGAR